MTCATHLPPASRAQPLVLSLQARSDELVVLGLCTLDGWVEAMYTEFLDPSTRVVSSELMLALWDLLKPPTAPPLNHGIAIKAMQVCRARVTKMGAPSSREGCAPTCCSARCACNLPLKRVAL